MPHNQVADTTEKYRFLLHQFLRKNDDDGKGFSSPHRNTFMRSHTSGAWELELENINNFKARFYLWILGASA